MMLLNINPVSQADRFHDKEMFPLESLMKERSRKIKSLL